MIYKFNTSELDTESYRLVTDGVEQNVEPQVFNLIVYLIQNKEKIISRDEILDAIWKDRVVSDSSINNHIKSARKVLGDDGHKQAVIKTVHSRGYQFIAQCESVDEEVTNDEPIKKPGSKSFRYLLQSGIILIVIAVMWLVSLYQTPNTSNDTLDNSIAVLAFKDLSPEADQNYFAEGVSEELLNIFTQIPDLKVASRTSSFSYKNKDMRLEDIGKELNVKYIMEGSVRKSNNKLRVAAQLIRVSDLSHVWSETYEHTVQDVFKIQDEIAKAVSDQLEVSLSNELAKTQPVDPQAHSLYLQALYYFKQNNNSDIKKSLDIINQSLEKNSLNALAWTLKSRIYYKMIQLHYEKKGLDFRKLAKESIARAKIIDNKLPTVNAQMALINLWDLDFSAARFNIDLATSVKNKNTDTIEIVAYYYQLTGQIEKSVKLLDEAIDQDPLNDTFYYNLSMGYYFLNQLKDAGKFMSKYYYFHEKAHLFKAMASQFYVSEGKNQDALELAKQEPNEFQKLLSMGYATHALGDNKQADDILNELLTKYSTSSSYIASLYAFRQDADNAFKWLNSAFDGRNTELLYAINFDTFQNLWDDPRWQLFINKISLPKEHWLIIKEIKAD